MELLKIGFLLLLLRKRIFSMKDESVGESRSKVMDPIRMIAIELCKLFGNHLNWNVFKF